VVINAVGMAGGGGGEKYRQRGEGGEDDSRSSAGVKGKGAEYEQE